MEKSPLLHLIRHFRRSLVNNGDSTLTDSQLLERWLDTRDEAARDIQQRCDVADGR